MNIDIIYDVEVDTCPKCHGIWLDYYELDQIEDIAWDNDDDKGTLIPKRFDTDYKCPKCDGKLELFFYRFFDLELEVCENNCGFFLDEGELDKLLHYAKQENNNVIRSFNAENQWAKFIRSFKKRI